MTSKANLRRIVLVSVSAILFMLVLGFVHSLTKEIISSNILSSKKEKLLKLIPKSYYNGDVFIKSLSVPETHLRSLGLDNGSDYHVVKNNGIPVALIIPAVGEGYSGDIKILVSIDMAGNIIEVRVTSHKETLGLGDKIEITKSPWISQFSGRSLSNTTDVEWGLIPDGGTFDSFTGATITPRAVVRQVFATLNFSKTILDRGYDSIKKMEGIN